MEDLRVKGLGLRMDLMLAHRMGFLVLVFLGGGGYIEGVEEGLGIGSYYFLFCLYERTNERTRFLFTYLVNFFRRHWFASTIRSFYNFLFVQVIFYLFIHIL